MSTVAKKTPESVLSLAQLLAQQPATPPASWIEPGLLPSQGILFVGGEPKVGKSLLVANLALLLAAGKERAGFSAPAARRVLMCQFELPTPQFVARLAVMRRAFGSTADQNLFIDTRAAGHLLSAPQGLNHFLTAARTAAAEVIVLDPLYSAHDQDENDTRAMAALCQCLLKLRETSKVALIVNRENDSNQNTPDLLMFVNSTLLSMIYIGTIALQNESKGIRYLWNASWKRC